MKGGRGWENATCLAWESWLSVVRKLKIIDISSGGCKARTTKPSCLGFKKLIFVKICIGYLLPA